MAGHLRNVGWGALVAGIAMISDKRGEFRLDHESGPAALPRRRDLILGAASFAAVGACSPMTVSPSTEVPTSADLKGLPYHPLPFHMDLCILSYQLYAQSLVWPFDPYYVKHANAAASYIYRQRVQAWAGSMQSRQSTAAPVPFGYRGPGRLQGFADNPRHEPILFRYDTLRPWVPAASIAEATWAEQQTPQAITGRIAEVQMCARPTAAGEGVARIADVARAGSAGLPGARDLLIAFEGGTGDKGEENQPASQSLMGFVLMRHIDGSRDYDVHIVFRGSRSGSLTRAAGLAFSDSGARGNPDWITDLGYDFIQANDISAIGQVHRGFAHSMRSMLPNLRAVFSRIAGRAGGRAPKRIYVTGHSLGGGLAQHFVSAMLLGERFGPDGQGPDMPRRLRAWPWSSIKLVNFAAPVSGDTTWAQALTSGRLQEQFFSEPELGITLSDPDALPVNDPDILRRLTATDRPAGFRVLHASDPITTIRFLGGNHVGQTVYVAPANRFGLANPKLHEPSDIRDRMLGALSDPSLPATGWRYRPMKEFAPGIARTDWGQPSVFDRFYDAIEGFYADYSADSEIQRLRADYALFQRLMDRG